MAVKNDINLEFDSESRDYYVVWQPIVVGRGKTKHKALEDLREAAHFGVDTLIDLKSADINNKKEA